MSDFKEIEQQIADLMTNEQRLAEAMGYSQESRHNDEPFPVTWISPDDKNLGRFAEWYCPIDPENDANDTEAVIRWLNELGYEVTIVTGVPGDVVWIRKQGSQEVPRYSGDNWKAGVVKLALKVIDND